MDCQNHYCERRTILRHRVTLIYEKAPSAEEVTPRKLIVATIHGRALRTMFSAKDGREALKKAKRLIQEAQVRRAKKKRAAQRAVAAESVPAAGWAN